MSGMSLEQRIEKEFLSMPLRPRNMSFYSVRTSILRSLKKETASFYGTVLDVGCGFMPYRTLVESVPAVERYVGMDIENPGTYGEAKPDLKWNGERIPTDDASFDCVMATEVLEHCSQPRSVLAEIYRVMRPGGRFFATVPFVWNLHEIPNDEYRYTPYSLERLLTDAGFRDISIKPLGGWNLALAQMIGLWLGFSRMSRPIRVLLRLLLFPVYAYLVLTDRRPERFDSGENSMFSGLSVIARKENNS